MSADPDPPRGRDPLDPEVRFRPRAIVDLHRGGLFRNALAELPRLSIPHGNAGYGGVKRLEELSARNLAAVRADCERLVTDADERNAFLRRFDLLRFYWKHGSGVYSLIQEDECLTSTTRLVEFVHGPAVTEERDAANPGDKSIYYHAYVADPLNPRRVVKKKFVNTTKFEYLFTGDAGYVFFRVNLGRRPELNTRFGEGGGVQFVFDPLADPRFHELGWITLRDVMLPYSRTDFQAGKFAITSADRASQRLSSYEAIERNLIPLAHDDTTPLSGAQLVVLGRDLARLPADLRHDERQCVLHEFRGETRAGRRERWEHVMEGAFHGPHIVDGLRYSALRAFCEIPPLWRQVLALPEEAPAVDAFMRVWLHKFFHIEGKYPWKLPLPGVVTAALIDDVDQDGVPVATNFGTTGAQVYYVPPDPDSDSEWESSSSSETGSTASNATLDYDSDFASDSSTEASTGWV